MRRLVLVGLFGLAAAVPAAPAHAGPAACVVTAGFPVCAGTCRAGDPITVIAVGTGVAPDGSASCGGGGAACTAFRGACVGTGSASGSGALSCGGSATVVICLVGIGAT